MRNIALEVGSPEVLKVSFPWRSQVSDNLISQTNARPTRLSSLLPVMVSNSNHWPARLSHVRLIAPTLKCALATSSSYKVLCKKHCFICRVCLLQCLLQTQQHIFGPLTKGSDLTQKVCYIQATLTTLSRHIHARSSSFSGQAFKANLIYPPGDPLGFWTSDTCSQKNDLSCKSGKFIRTSGIIRSAKFCTFPHCLVCPGSHRPEV